MLTLKKQGLFLGAGILLFLWAGVSSYTQKSNTFDEEYHLLRGIYPWRTGNFSGDRFHPPFINMFATIPLIFNPKVHLPEEHPPKLYKDTEPYYQFLWKNEEDPEKILYPCRFMMLLLGASLALAIYSWSREIYGPAGGLFSAVLMLLCPNIAAHSQVVTTDIGVTLFIFLASYLLWRWTEAPSRGRLIAVGLALGMAQISKHSAAILFPVFLVIVSLYYFRRNPKDSLESRLTDSGRETVKTFLFLLVLSLGVITLGYLFQPGVYFEQFFKFSRQAVSNDLPRSYFLGKITIQYFWYAPLAVMALKTPLPLLLLIPFSFFVRMGTPEKFMTRFILVLVPLAVLASAMTIAKNTELRYVLPFYPFLFVLLGRCAAFLKKQKSWQALSVLGLTVWLLAENVSIYPDYLAYFNQIAGGPDHGKDYLLNSNLDWGQDLKGLARYIQKHKIPKIGLSYQGKGEPNYYKIPYELMPNGLFESPFTSLSRYRNTVPLAVWPPNGFVAISASDLMGNSMPAPVLQLYKPLRRIKPTAIIGHTIYVYYFPPRQ